MCAWRRWYSSKLRTLPCVVWLIKKSHYFLTFCVLRSFGASAVTFVSDYFLYIKWCRHNRLSPCCWQLFSLIYYIFILPCLLPPNRQKNLIWYYLQQVFTGYENKFGGLSSTNSALFLRAFKGQVTLLHAALFDSPLSSCALWTLSHCGFVLPQLMTR